MTGWAEFLSDDQAALADLIFEETQYADLADPRLCAAIVDRLTFNGTIVETGTDSYRLSRTAAKQPATNTS